MKLSIVTTLYYSQPYLADFFSRITRSAQQITADYEIIFVNDGSPDDSLQTALQLQQTDPRVVVIELSKNFGHHKAIMTGLVHAQGAYVFLIDSDLEEEPEILTTFWQEMQQDQSADVVYGVQPTRKGGWFERISGQIYYRTFTKMYYFDYPHNTLTARLMKSKYVQNVVRFRESELDIWGVFVLTGFVQKPVYIKKHYKGKSTYTFRRKIRMSIDSLTSFSNRPLTYIFLMGAFITLASLCIVVAIIIQKVFFEVSIQGWTSILVSIWLIGGMLMFCVGVIGIYLSKMFTEIKQRPTSIIKNIYRRQDGDETVQ